MLFAFRHANRQCLREHKAIFKNGKEGWLCIREYFISARNFTLTCQKRSQSIVKNSTPFADVAHLSSLETETSFHFCLEKTIPTKIKCNIYLLNRESFFVFFFCSLVVSEFWYRRELFSVPGEAAKEMKLIFHICCKCFRASGDLGSVTNCHTILERFAHSSLCRKR